MIKNNLVNGDGKNENSATKEAEADNKKDLMEQKLIDVESALKTHQIADGSSGSETDSEDSDEDTGTDAESEEVKAPVELLGEFLLYIRKGNWVDAKKLCQMILIYEPQNAEALQFRDVINEKIQVEKELEEESSEEDDDDEDDSTSSSDDDEKADNDENAQSDEESSDDEDESKREHLKNKLIFPEQNSDNSRAWKP